MTASANNRSSERAIQRHSAHAEPIVEGGCTTVPHDPRPHLRKFQRLRLRASARRRFGRRSSVYRALVHLHRVFRGMGRLTLV